MLLGDLGPFASEDAAIRNSRAEDHEDSQDESR